MTDRRIDVEAARREFELAQVAASWERLSAKERDIMTRNEESDGTSWLVPYPEPGWGEEMKAAIHLKRIGLIDTCTHAYWRTRDGRRVAFYGRERT